MLLKVSDSLIEAVKNMYISIKSTTSNQLSKNQWMTSWHCLFVTCCISDGVIVDVQQQPEFVSLELPLVEIHEIALTWIKFEELGQATKCFSGVRWPVKLWQAGHGCYWFVILLCFVFISFSRKLWVHFVLLLPLFKCLYGFCECSQDIQYD